MKDNKVNFTKMFLVNVELPVGVKRSCYYDSQVSGLGVMVFPSGTKTFFLYKRVNGKPDKIKLGKFPELSVEQARKAAYAAVNLINSGKNPNKEKQIVQSEYTFKEIFDKFLEDYAKKRKKTWKEDQNIYSRYLAILVNKKLSVITRSDIEKLHHNIGDTNGIYAANHALALIRTVFNKAISWGWKGANPCSEVKKFKEKSRERFLQGNELPRFFEALDKEPNEKFRVFFYICLLTGARRSNVLSMNWNDINLDCGTWCIQETKNGDPQTIPLSDEAINILKRIMASRTNDWVFPSTTSASGHVKEPKKVWKRVLKMAGIKDLRIHDLRRTLGSWLAATGANSFIIGKSLGHKTQSSTAIYARLNLDPVRESVSKATSAMFAFTNNK
jgi:integrase